METKHPVTVYLGEALCSATFSLHHTRSQNFPFFFSSFFSHLPLKSMEIRREMLSCTSTAYHVPRDVQAVLRWVELPAPLCLPIPLGTTTGLLKMSNICIHQELLSCGCGSSTCYFCLSQELIMLRGAVDFAKAYCACNYKHKHKCVCMLKYTQTCTQFAKSR